MEPISVTIRDFMKQSRNLNWLGKGARWIEAGGSVTVDYDPWSCADRKQRESILAELTNRYVTFTLHVLNADGKVIETSYDPALSMGIHKPAVTVKPESRPQPPEVTHRDVRLDDRSHIVVAGGSDPDIKDLGFRAEPVTPPGKDLEPDPKTGFKSEAVKAPGAVLTTDVLGTDSVAEEFRAPAADVTVEYPAPTPKDLFEDAVADKRWDDALQILIDTFGADKVTFTTRAVMASKSWDAIVKKYSLSELAE